MNRRGSWVARFPGEHSLALGTPGLHDESPLGFGGKSVRGQARRQFLIICTLTHFPGQLVTHGLPGPNLGDMICQGKQRNDGLLMLWIFFHVKPLEDSFAYFTSLDIKFSKESKFRIIWHLGTK